MMEIRLNPWNQDSIHVILDWETCGLKPGCAPVQLVAKVRGSAGEEFVRYISAAKAEQAGYTVDAETMQWWNKQDPQLRAKVFAGEQSVGEVIHEFATWLKGLGDPKNTYLWGNGVEFDVAMLVHAWEQEMSEPFPVPFRNFDHTRTLYRTVSGVTVDRAVKAFNKLHPSAVPHDAVWDVRFHAYLVEDCLDWLGF